MLIYVHKYVYIWVGVSGGVCIGLCCEAYVMYVQMGFFDVYLWLFSLFFSSIQFFLSFFVLEIMISLFFSPF